MHKIESVNIGDGARLFMCDTELFKVETLTLLLAFPEDVKRATEISLLLSVMKRGCKKYPTLGAINEHLDELYSSTVSFKNMRTDNVHLVGLGAETLRAEYTDGECDPLLETLEVMSEMLFSPLLDENGEFLHTYVESEKKNQILNIDSQINDPRSYATLRCREITLAPLGMTETLETSRVKTQNASASSLCELYKSIIKNSALLAFYVGDRSAGEIEKLIRPIAERLNKTGKRSEKILYNDKNNIIRLPKRKMPQTVEEKRTVSQARLNLSFECSTSRPDEDYPAMLLFNELLGAGTTSRLMRVLREERGLCYECSSSYDSARGVVFVSTGTDRDACAEARREIEKQIRTIARGEIDDDELIAAKKSLYSNYATVNDYSQAIERYCLGAMLAGSDPDPDKLGERIMSLNKSSVAEAAKKLTLDTVYVLGAKEDSPDE